jgi:hypothetical protein
MTKNTVPNSQESIPMSKPHHKPKNITLTKIARLSKPVSFIPFVADTDADRAIKGQHLGFDVSVNALLRSRGL